MQTAPVQEDLGRIGRTGARRKTLRDLKTKETGRCSSRRENILAVVEGKVWVVQHTLIGSDQGGSCLKQWGGVIVCAVTKRKKNTSAQTAKEQKGKRKFHEGAPHPNDRGGFTH